MAGGLVSPSPSDLPRLPPWAAPNGWDYWGRPWAYMDAPSGHKRVGVSSALSLSTPLVGDCGSLGGLST